MKLGWFIFACWFNIVHSASPDNFYNDDTNIIEATSRSFDRIVHRTNYTSLVEFYAPWCGHCRNLAPTMKKVAKRLNELVQVVTVNCDVESNKPLCAENGVEGFPTLKVFKPQKVDMWPSSQQNSTKKVQGKLNKHVFETYLGERKMSTIVDYCLSRIKNYVKKLGKVDNLYKLNDILPSNNRLPVVIFSKNDRISPVLKSMALDWLDTIQFFSLYNKKVSSTVIPATGPFNDKYPNMVKQLNQLLASIKENPTVTQMIVLDFVNDSIIKYTDGAINKENVNKFLQRQFQLKPKEGPFSDRGMYLERLRTGKKLSKKKKPVSEKQNSSQHKKNTKKAKKSTPHDEL